MMTAKPDTDTLRDLDRELDAAIECDCRCDRTMDRHGDGKCLRVATHYVELHDLGVCDDPRRRKLPSVTPEGFRASFLCDGCLKACERNVNDVIVRTRGRAMCAPPPVGFGCGRPMTQISFIPVRKVL